MILEIHDTLEIEGRFIKILQRKLNFLNFKKIIKITVTTETFKKIFYG